LKSGKAPGVDDIPNDFLKYGGDSMVRSLTELFFTAISDIELIPDDWQKGIVKPLHKSGSVYDLDNYRGITLSSNVYKLFTKTLEISVLDHLESKNILGENQGAFRKSRRLEDHLFTLQVISSLYKSSKKPLYLPFLDLSKAFDRVWREGLFALLWFLVSFRIFFSDNTRVRIFILFCRAKHEFFFHNSTLGYDENSESDYFFSSTKIRIFFSATLGIRIFFRKKTITPPPPTHTHFKLNGRSLIPTCKVSQKIRILGEHGDFNRVNFGEALWKNVIRPSLTHACAVWMSLSSSSKKNSRKLAISCRENNITYQNEYP
jgi:hypothetical protein